MSYLSDPNDAFSKNVEPLIATVSMGLKKGLQPDFGLKMPIVSNGSSIDFSKYALRTKSVFIIDLDDPKDKKRFNPDTYEFNEKKQFTDIGSISKYFGTYDNYHLINFCDVPKHIENASYDPNRTASEAQYIHSDTHIDMADFLLLIMRGLQALGRPRNGPNEINHLWAGLVLECVPFKTKEYEFGSGGRITAVNDAIDLLDANTDALSLIDAVSERLTFPARNEILMITSRELEKNAAKKTNNIGYDKFSGALLRVASYHRLAYKITQIPGFAYAEVFTDNTNQASMATIFGHRSFLAEIVYHGSEYGRGNDAPRTIPRYIGAGGFSVIVMNPDNMDGKFETFSVLHEFGHSLCPGHVNDYLKSSPQYSRTRAASSTTNSNLIWSNWRGFGDGTPVVFTSGGGAHPTPRSKIEGTIRDAYTVFHACPMIYGIKGGGLGSILPMPSTSLMSYSSCKVLSPGSMYHGSAYFGAVSQDSTTEPFGCSGEVLSYEAVISIIHENIANGNVFTLFDSAKASSAYTKTIGTFTYFLRMQILWAGLQSAKSDSSDIQFLTNVNVSDHSALWYKKIKYTGRSYTQEEEYKMPYEDESSNLDYLKRDPNHNDSLHTGDIEETNNNGQGGGYRVTSHVADEFLAKMDFEILEDVIEVINGEPRKTLTGNVAKYHYIVSTTKEETEAKLKSSFPHKDEDINPIIKSIWNGRKMAKKMAVRNDQGKEECKYVYVICRDASDLSFSNTTINGDLSGTSVSIK